MTKTLIKYFLEDGDPEDQSTLPELKLETSQGLKNAQTTTTSPYSYPYPNPFKVRASRLALCYRYLLS